MGRICCAVAGCLSVKTPLSSSSFYRIYARNRDAHVWTDFCRNPVINKNSQICSKHFTNNSFINPRNKSQGLRSYAIPSLFPAVSEEQFDCSISTAQIPMETDSNCFSANVEGVVPMDVDREYNESEIETAGEVVIEDDYHGDRIPLSNAQTTKCHGSHISHDHDYGRDIERVVNAMERLVIVEEENRDLKKKIRNHQKQSSKQKNRIKKLQEEVFVLKRTLAEQSQRLYDPILSEIQKNKSRKLRGARYSDKMKNMAVVLHYCSNKAYRQMRQYFTLPSISTIRGWLSKLKVTEGYSKTILQLLKLRVSGLPEDEKLVTIVMDEMSITQRLTYVANAEIDYFMGFPTKVGKEDNNLKQRASNALTIMVKSMKSGFKQAIGYFFNASNANAARLSTILNEGIKLVAETGLVPKMITCDQNSTNRSLFKTLGITEHQPWFLYKKQKIPKKQLGVINKHAC